MSLKALLPLLLAGLLVPTASASAQDDGGYLEDEEEEAKGKAKARRSDDDPGQIREIVRGFYAKANAGAAAYFLDFNGWVKPGTFVGLSVGQDFVDNERQSMAWEIALTQGVHNGEDYVTQADDPSSPHTQGDLRTYALQASYEFSVYPSRRLGIGFRVGAGALYSPLLIHPVAYEEDVLPEYGGDPGYHNAVHPFGFGGPTIEYYTKLSHLSVGIDADVFYAYQWDLGLNASGSLKYTF